jgi:hypothetical protein
MAGLITILGALLMFWLAPARARRLQPHAPAVIRFEPPMHGSPPVKIRRVRPPQAI